jgi:hypothetical protein
VVAMNHAIQGSINQLVASLDQRFVAK